MKILNWIAENIAIEFWNFIEIIKYRYDAANSAANATLGRQNGERKYNWFWKENALCLCSERNELASIGHCDVRQTLKNQLLQSIQLFCFRNSSLGID